MKRQALIAEFIGTFALVFFGTGAVIVEELVPGSVSPVGIALAFGLVVMVMIDTLGSFSGAHFNPAVSLGFLLNGSLKIADFFAYLIVQILGGLAASFLLRVIFPRSATLGGTFARVSVPAAFTLEILLTFFLMFVILRIVAGGNSGARLAGIVIGSTVGLAALVAGPVTGASMNPVRSLAPAVAAHVYKGLWVYLTAPFLGASLAVLVNKAFIHSNRG